MHVGLGRLMALILAAAVALSLSGCAGNAGDDAGGPVAETGPAAEAHGLEVLRTAKGDATVHDVWANGTVAFQDSCNTGGCAQDRSVSFRATDITDHLPKGMPIRVQAELAYEPHVLYGPSWELTVEAPDSSVYTYTHAVDLGSAEADATLMAQGMVEVLLSIYQPGGGVPDTPYSLRIRISSDPLTLLPGVPVGIELGPGDNVSAEVPFLLFAPDGEPLGRFFKLHNLAEDSADGQYILILLPDGAPSPISSSRAGDLRTLRLRTEAGPVGTVPQQGALDEPWDVAGVPVGMGLRIFSKPGAGGMTFLASAGFSASLVGPDGPVIETGAFCSPGFCLTLGPLGLELRWATSIGDERVVPGAYTLHVESQATYEAFVEPFAVYVAA